MALQSSSAASPISAGETITWTRVPSPTCSVAKQSLPASRENITWAGHPDQRAAAAARFEPDADLAHLGERVGAADPDRVGLAAGPDQPAPLGLADSDLLGQIVDDGEVVGSLAGVVGPLAGLVRSGAGLAGPGIGRITHGCSPWTSGCGTGDHAVVVAQPSWAASHTNPYGSPILASCQVCPTPGSIWNDTG